MLDFRLAVLFGPLGGGVHGTDGGFGHREQERPGEILCIEILDEGFHDQGIFLAVAHQWLVGDVVQDGHSCTGGFGERHGDEAIAVAWGVADGTAADEENGGFRVIDHTFSRLDNFEAVLPDDALPFLGVHFEGVNFDPKDAGFFFLFPLERIVSLFDIGVQISMSRCGGHTGQKQGPECIFEHLVRNSMEERGTLFALRSAGHLKAIGFGAGSFLMCCA